jgi:ribosome-binding factor A
MPREFPRTRRVGEQLQRELASLIFEELKDPRLGMVSVSGTRVSRDLSHAKVYVSVLGDEQVATASLKVLNHAAGFLRHKLGQRMRLRTVPELRFHIDHSIEEGARIDALIDAAVAGRLVENNNGQDDES